MRINRLELELDDLREIFNILKNDYTLSIDKLKSE